MSITVNTKKGRHLEGFRENPVSAAVATKLVEDQRHVKPVRGGVAAPETSTLAKVSQMTAGSIQDAKNVFEVLPETELLMQILVSGIQSPNDFRTPELSWAAENSVLSPGLLKDIITIHRGHFEKVYRIKDLLTPLLQDTLFHTGSYPLIVIPESSIDDIINPKNPKKNTLSTEQFKTHFTSDLKTLKPMGFLGNPSATDTSQTTLGLEHLLSGEAGVSTEGYNPIVDKTDGMITVTDNFEALKLPLLVDKIRKQRAGNLLGAHKSKLSQEALKIRIKATDVPIESTNVIGQLYQRKQATMREIQAVGTSAQSSRAPVGHPLVIKAPSESVIPVTLPGSPETAVGAFILLDDFGHPVTYTRNNTYFNQLNQRMSKLNQSSGEAGASDLLQRLNQYTDGTSSRSVQLDLDKMYQAYGMVVENDLKSRIRNGIYGGDVDIAKPEEAYRIMLARQLSNQRTQLLWIPAELLTYVAFDYNEMGIGVSLVEKSKLLSSIRAVLTVVNTLGAIKNSTSRRRYDIQLDPAEEDPRGAVELITTEIAKVQGGGFVIGSTSPVQISDGIRQAAIEINVSGHPAYPETKVLMDDVQTSRVLVDTEYEEMMRKRWMMSYGLTPETVDAASGTDFAANIIQSNLLLNKRIAVYQEKTGFHLTDHVVKYTRESGTLIREFTRVIQEHVGNKDVPYLKDEDSGIEIADVTASDIIEEYLSCLSISLPPPDTTQIAANTEQYTAFSEALDVMLPAYLPETVLAAMGGSEGNDRREQVFDAVKSYFLRKFMAENNILPELQVLLNSEKLEENEFNLKTEHLALMEGLSRTIGDFIKGMGLVNDKVNEGLGETGGTSDDSVPATDAGGGGDDVFDLGGGDDEFKLDEPEPEATDDDKVDDTPPTPTDEPKVEPEVKQEPVEEPGLDELE